MSRSINFSWKALLLAPLPIPLICTALLLFSSSGKNPVTGFLFLFALGSVVFYGVTIFLFLPCFVVISMFTPMTAIRTALLGTVLAAVVYAPFIWQEYRASGVDSGPPQVTFGEYLRQHTF